MNKIYTLVFVMAALCGLQNSLSSQQIVEFSFSPDQTIQANQEFEVDLLVDNLEDVIGAQFAVTWDPNVLKIESIDSISASIPDLGPQSFALPSQTVNMTPGVLRVSIATLQAFSVPDNHRIVKMKFSTVGDSCQFTSMQVEDITFLPVEIIDAQFNLIPFASQAST